MRKRIIGMGQPPNLNSANILECSVWSQTAKFNDRQYIRLYGIKQFMYRRHMTCVIACEAINLIVMALHALFQT